MNPKFKKLIDSILTEDKKSATLAFRRCFIMEAEQIGVGEQDFLKLMVRDIRNGYRKETGRYPDRAVVQQNINKIYGMISDIEDAMIDVIRYNQEDIRIQDQLRKSPNLLSKLSAKHKEIRRLKSDALWQETSTIEELEDELSSISSPVELSDFTLENNQLVITLIDNFDPRSGTKEVMSGVDFLQIMYQRFQEKKPDIADRKYSEMVDYFETILNKFYLVRDGNDVEFRDPRGKDWQERVKTYTNTINGYLGLDKLKIPKVLNIFLRNGLLYVEVEHPW